MTRAVVLGLVVTTWFACGPKPVPTNLAPLPPDKPVEAEKAKPAVAPKEVAGEPAVPTAPKALEVKLPAAQVTVKLVSPGKGKRVALRYGTMKGGKQKVEIAMDFASTTSQGGASQEQAVPTIVLVGDAEAVAVDQASGKTDYAFTVTGTDARDVKDAKGAVPAAKFKVALESLNGLTIGGSVGANGAGGEVTMRIEKPSDLSVGALELIRLTLPTWPVLPSEPIAVGAKWQATTVSKLADRLDVTQVTDYEVIAQKGKTWTIKGTTKVTGTDQNVDGGKISAISGSGSSEVTVTDGTLYPTFKSSVETKFSATDPSEQGKPGADTMVDFRIKIGGTVTPK